LEQKKLYGVRGGIPEKEYVIPLGLADVKRAGTDVTVISYGRTVRMCLDAADRLAAAEGADVEVLDIRTLVPLDAAAIARSVKKTGRVVIVHESAEFSGFGAEIAAQIAAGEAFFHLAAPIRRVGAYYCPIPFSPGLEASVFPTPARIEAAVREVLNVGKLRKNEKTLAIGPVL
jgi:pyruvate dehydrogenase E1 component beta subunit